LVKLWGAKSLSLSFGEQRPSLPGFGEAKP
jgi:hypothetical protein